MKEESKDTPLSDIVISDTTVPKEAVLKKRESRKVTRKKRAQRGDFSKKNKQETKIAEESFKQKDRSPKELSEENTQKEILSQKAVLEESVSEEGPTSYYAPLFKIGINVQLGLDYCCGEDDFCMEMLRMFCSQAEEKKAEIVSLYEAANWADYAVKVHALKSTSLTIGAERLAEQAKLLELAGKERNIEYIRHSHPILLRLYDEVCETIERL